jgi:hypothetical protein
MEVRATMVAHGRPGRLLEPHPRGLWRLEGGRAGMCPHGITGTVSAPRPRGGSRLSRAQVVRPAE